MYDAPSVEPGTYDITFSKEGFQKLVRSNIVLHVEAITIDAQLQIGSAAQQVTVESGAPLVQTGNFGPPTDSDNRSSDATTQHRRQLVRLHRAIAGSEPG